VILSIASFSPSRENPNARFGVFEMRQLFVQRTVDGCFHKLSTPFSRTMYATDFRPAHIRAFLRAW